MRKATLILVAIVASMPARAELLQVDFTVLGMD